MPKKKANSGKRRKSKSEPQKRGPGRPPGRDRTIQVKARFNGPEHAAIETAADQAGQTVGIWLREVALDAAGYIAQPPPAPTPPDVTG